MASSSFAMAKIVSRVLLFDLLPAGAAELVERRRGAVGADVLLHQADAIDRQVQPVAAGVVEMQVVAFGVGDLEMLEAAVAADAVIDVHDEVVRLQLAEVLQQLPDVDAARAAALARFAEDVGLGDDHEMLVGNAEAVAEMADDESAAAARRAVEGRCDAAGDRTRWSTSWLPNSRRQPLDLRRVLATTTHPVSLIAPRSHALGDRAERHLAPAGRRARSSGRASGTNAPRGAARPSPAANMSSGSSSIVRPFGQRRAPFARRHVQRFRRREEAPLGSALVGAALDLCRTHVPAPRRPRRRCRATPGCRRAGRRPSVSSDS